MRFVFRIAYKLETKCTEIGFLMHLKVVHNSLETKKPESTIVLNLEEFQINNSLEESDFNQGLDESYINQGLEDSRIQEMQVYQYDVLNEFNNLGLKR